MIYTYILSPVGGRGVEATGALGVLVYLVGLWSRIVHVAAIVQTSVVKKAHAVDAAAWDSQLFRPFEASWGLLGLFETSWGRWGRLGLSVEAS